MSLNIKKSDQLNNSILSLVKDSESLTTKSYFSLFDRATDDTIKEQLEELEDCQQSLANISQDSTSIDSEKAQKIIAKRLWVGKKKLESSKVQLEKILQYLTFVIKKIEANPDDKNIDACLRDLFTACDCFLDFSKNTIKELEVFLVYCGLFQSRVKFSKNQDFTKVILKKLIRKVKAELRLRKKTPQFSPFKKQVFIFSGTEMKGVQAIASLQKKITEKGQSVTLIDIDTQEGQKEFLALRMDESTKYRVFTHGYLDGPSKITPSMLHKLFNCHFKTIKKKKLILPISLVVCHSAEGGENSYARQLGKLLNDSGVNFRIKAYEGVVSVHIGTGTKLAHGKHNSHKFVFSNDQDKITSYRVRKLDTLDTDDSGSEEFFQLFSCDV